MRALIAGELQRFANTCIWSLNGWTAAWASEKTLRQWSIVNLISASIACIVDLTAAERAVILALGLLILGAELLNTAIEEIVDNISPGHSAWARKAKDCGSACVALAALAAGVAWVVVLVG